MRPSSGEFRGQNVNLGKELWVVDWDMRSIVSRYASIKFSIDKPVHELCDDLKAVNRTFFPSILESFRCAGHFFDAKFIENGDCAQAPRGKAHIVLGRLVRDALESPKSKPKAGKAKAGYVQ